ncbi:CBS-domain-containing protein [Wallemia mellicola]|nr:CBS-domain-containing protein [Wallemia mellicola]
MSENNSPQNVDFPTQDTPQNAPESKRSKKFFGALGRSRKSSGSHKRTLSSSTKSSQPLTTTNDNDKSRQSTHSISNTDQDSSILPQSSTSPSITTAPTTAPSHTRSRTVSSTYPPSKIHAEPTRTSSNSHGIGGKFQALRKKIETELGKKRPGSSNPRRDHHGRDRKRNNKQPGTVASLRPSPALTVPDSMTVADASQLCAAKRTDCVLVVDDEESLCGIFTAKDLAFRVVAESIDTRHTPVSEIMTPNPMVTRDSASATEALELMVARAFRHLPVCNDDGDVVGLLDITRVFNEALDKIERGYGASQKLYNALEGVQNELGGNTNSRQAAAMMNYVDALRERMALPDLQSVLDARTHPATVSVRTTVREAARIMKQYRTTAVCVMDNPISAGTGGHLNSQNQPRIAGIFTSKDVVLRVIAAGLQPDRCSVVRVMTPHPDRAPPSMTIQEALRKMYTGHYLNMPVVEDDGKLIAIVDVLKLTYAILEQINSMSQEQQNETGEEASGPMWGKFFGTLAAAPDDNDSVVSGSRDVASPQGGRNDSELHPNDSASVVDHSVDHDASQIGIDHASSGVLESEAANGVVDEHIAVFKFVSPSQRIHRFESPTLSLEHLRDIVAGKLSTDPFFTQHIEKAPVEDENPAPAPDPYDFSLLYEDDDGDHVVMSADSDVKDAVFVAQKKRQTRVLLIVNGGKGWETVDVVKPADDKPAVVIKEENIHQSEAVEEVETLEKKIEKETNQQLPHEAHTSLPSNKSTGPADGEVFGIPRDLVLPAAIAFAGSAVLIAFIGSKFASK